MQFVGFLSYEVSKLTLISIENNSKTIQPISTGNTPLQSLIHKLSKDAPEMVAGDEKWNETKRIPNPV